ncbi:MAG: DNA translocase FtsK 4TM domain-containing protein [Patescibacteria group bacterium]|nr:DNA translocase FtsK 4TM domain-containing protein [Patescibacteria group bacterium]
MAQRGRPPKAKNLVTTSILKGQQKRKPGRPPKLHGRKRKGSMGFLFNIGMQPEVVRGIMLVVFFIVGILSLLSLIGLAGKMGEFMSMGLRQAMGRPAYIFPFLLIGLAIAIFRSERLEEPNFSKYNLIGATMFLIGLCGIFHVKYNGETALGVIKDGVGGGYLGYAFAYPMQLFMGFWAAGVILLAVFVIGSIMTFNISLKDVIEGFKQLRLFILKLLHKQPIEGELTIKGMNERSAVPVEAEGNSELHVKDMEDGKAKKSVIRSKKWGDWKPFPLELLNNQSTTPMAGDVKNNARVIQQTLKSFNINVKMQEVNVGPTVTQYTFKPMEGVKLSQIVTLNNDLALSLAAHPIRIEAPIPGKSLVGVEVPNQKVALVRLREILESKEFTNSKSSLTMVLGRNVAGSPTVCELDKMPHLLISGATGSGKSICLNTIIMSLLYQNSPDDLRLILVDPKKVEMTNYEGIPHLLTPVITEVDKTVNALRWTVSEMEKRFTLFAECKKRDIHSYNASAGKDRLPFIVVVIDELADLMAVASKEVEAAIVRLSQMARATGIHLILATQRPSVNVITGLIKANITARIAFAVASQIDSRTIIDVGGAERLLGNGDMLFISPDLGKPRRVQGSFVTEKDIHSVTKFLKDKGEPEYDESIVQRQQKMMANGVAVEGEVDDELYEEAKETVIMSGKASASLLQRRLRVGYARAARLLDILEERGIVGQADGAKPREILVAPGDTLGLPSKEELANKQFNNNQL